MPKNKPTGWDREKALTLTLQNTPSSPVVDVETTAILRRAKRYAKFLAENREPKSLDIEKADPTEVEKPVTGDTESEQKLIDAGWNSALDYIMDEFLAGSGSDYGIVGKVWLRNNLGELRRG